MYTPLGKFFRAGGVIDGQHAAVPKQHTARITTVPRPSVVDQHKMPGPVEVSSIIGDHAAHSIRADTIAGYQQRTSVSEQY
jgi:hypothetical protein